MSVATPAGPTSAAAERLRGRALELIRSISLEIICASDEPIRTVDLARQVADELAITFTAEEVGGLASVARLVLDSDPFFSQSNRQWDLAFRMGRAEGDRKKPVERAIEDFAELFGRPVSAEPVAVLIAAVYGRTPDYYERMIERLLSTGRDLFPLQGRAIGVGRWMVDLTSDDPEDVEFDNFSDPDSLKPLRAAAGKLKAGDALSLAVGLVEKSVDPIDNRALLFCAWERFPDTEPRALFKKLCGDERVVMERGPSWTSSAGHRGVLDAILELCRDPEAAAEVVAAAVPAEDDDLGIIAPTAIRVSDEDLQQVHDFMRAYPERTYSAPELCQLVLEAFPGSRTYASVHASLLERMAADTRFAWVGTERFRQAGQIPAEVQSLPEGLAFDDREYEAEEEEDADRLVDPREWKFNLDEQIQHPLVQDVGDDGSDAGSGLRELVASPPLHHYVAGTLYLRHSDAGLFPREPDLVQISADTGKGNKMEVWVNHRLGLVFGLKNWYEANLPWVGGRLKLAATSETDVFQLSVVSGPEELMDIPMERLQALLQLRGEAATETLTLTEIVSRLLKAHPDGVHFVRLFTELNVVRRIRRAHLAGILSAQRYFSQNAQTPGIWSFDEKRAQKSKTKKKGGPRRPMRLQDEDEDAEFEYE